MPIPCCQSTPQKPLTWEACKADKRCHLQGRGGSTGYDNAVALPARSDSDELEKENNKSTAALKGQAVFSIAKVHLTGSFNTCVLQLQAPNVVAEKSGGLHA